MKKIIAIKGAEDERSMLLKIADGDQRAFTSVFENYAHALGDYVFRITRSQIAAEEIVQDVFTIIWQKRSSLHEIQNFSNYLFIIAKNKTFNYLRNIAAERNREVEWSRKLEEEFTEIEQSGSKEEIYLLIDEVINKLPPQQKRVYNLSRVERLKHEEIARNLGISKETVKKHMKLALLSLRLNLKSILQKTGTLFTLNFIFFTS